MISRTLQRLQNDDAFKKTLADFVEVLEDYGMFEVLRERGQPDFIAQGTNPHAMAAQGAKSYGYFLCLDDIKHFKEKFLTPPPPQVNPSKLAKFGGKEAAIAKGYLTEEEANDATTK